MKRIQQVDSAPISINGLETQNQRVRESLSKEFEQQSKQLYKFIKERDEKIVQFKSQIEDMKKKEASLKHEAQRLEAAVKKQNAELQVLNQERLQTKADKRSPTTEQEKLIKHLHGENDSLKQTLREKDQELERFKTQLQQAFEENDSLTLRYHSELSQLKKGPSTQLFSESRDLERLQKELQAKVRENLDMAEKEKTLRLQIIELTDQLEKPQSNTGKLIKKRHSEIQASLFRRSHPPKHAQSEGQSVQSELSDNDESKIDVMHRQNDGQAADGDLIKELRDKIKLLNDEVGEYEENQAYYQQEMEKYRSLFLKEQEKRMELEGYYKMAYEQVQRNVVQEEEFQAQISDLTQKLAEAETAFQYASEKSEDLHAQNKILQDENARLLQQLDDQQQFKPHQVELDLTELNSGIKMNEFIEPNINDLYQEIQDQKSQIKSQESMIGKKQQRIDELQKECEQLKAAGNEATKNKLFEEHQKEKNELARQFLNLQNRIRDLEQENERLLKQLDDGNRRQCQTTVETEPSAKKAENGADEYSRAVKQEIESLRASCDSLYQELQHSRAENEKLKSQVAKLTSEVDQSRQELQQENDIAAINRILNDHSESLNQLEIQNQDAQENHSEVIQKLQNDVCNLAKQLELQRTNNQQLMTQLKQQADLLEQAQLKEQELQTRLSDLSKELQVSNQKEAILQKQIDDYSVSKQQNEEEFEEGQLQENEEQDQEIRELQENLELLNRAIRNSNKKLEILQFIIGQKNSELDQFNARHQSKPSLTEHSNQDECLGQTDKEILEGMIESKKQELSQKKEQIQILEQILVEKNYIIDTQSRQAEMPNHQIGLAGRQGPTSSEQLDRLKSLISREPDESEGVLDLQAPPPSNMEQEDEESLQQLVEQQEDQLKLTKEKIAALKQCVQQQNQQEGLPNSDNQELQAKLENQQGQIEQCREQISILSGLLNMKFAQQELTAQSEPGATLSDEDSIATQLQQSANELKKMQEQIQILEGLIQEKNLELDLAASEKVDPSLRDQSGNVERELEKCQQQIEILKELIEQKRAELDQKDQQSGSVDQKEQKDLSQELEQRRKEVQVLKAELNKLSEKLADAPEPQQSGQLEQVSNKELEELELQKASLQDDIARLQSAIAQQEEDRGVQKNLLKKPEDAAKSELSSQIQDAKEQQQILQQLLDQKTLEVNEKKRLSELLSGEEGLDQQLIESQQHLESLQQKVRELSEELEVVNAQLEPHANSEDPLQHEQLKEQHCEIQKAQEQIRVLTELIEKKQKEQQNQIKLAEGADDLQKQLTEGQQLKDELSVKLSRLQEELNQLTETEQQNTKADLEGKLAEQKAEIERLQEEIRLTDFQQSTGNQVVEPEESQIQSQVDSEIFQEIKNAENQLGQLREELLEKQRIIEQQKQAQSEFCQQQCVENVDDRETLERLRGEIFQIQSQIEMLTQQAQLPTFASQEEGNEQKQLDEVSDVAQLTQAVEKLKQDLALLQQLWIAPHEQQQNVEIETETFQQDLAPKPYECQEQLMEDEFQQQSCPPTHDEQPGEVQHSETKGLEQQVENLLAEKVGLEQTISNIEQVVRQLHDKLKNLESENQDLKLQFKDQQSSLQQSNPHLQSEEQGQPQQREQKPEKRSQGEDQVSVGERQELVALKEENKSLLNQIAKCSLEIARNGEYMNQLNEEIRNLQQEKKDIRSASLQQFNIDIEKLTKENDVLRQQLGLIGNDLKHQIKSLQQEVGVLQKDNFEKSEQINQLQGLVDALSKKNAEANSTNEELMQQRYQEAQQDLIVTESLEDKLKQVEPQFQIAHSEYNQLLADYQRLSLETQVQKREIRQLIASRVEVDRGIMALNIKLLDQYSENEKLRQYAGLHVQNEQQAKLIRQYEYQLQEVKIGIQKMNEKVIKLYNQNLESTQNLERTVQIERLSMKEWRQKYLDLKQTEFEPLVESYQNLEKSYQDLHRNQKKLELQYQDQLGQIRQGLDPDQQQQLQAIQDYQSKILELQGQNELLLAELKRSQEEAQNLKTQNQNLLSSIDDLQGELDRQCNQFNQFQRQDNRLSKSQTTMVKYPKELTDKLLTPLSNKSLKSEGATSREEKQQFIKKLMRLSGSAAASMSLRGDYTTLPQLVQMSEERRSNKSESCSEHTSELAKSLPPPK